MEDTVAAAFKIQLEQLLKNYEETSEIADNAAKTVDLDQSKVGRLSRMDALQAQAMSVEQNRRRQLHVRQIHAALNRIEQGDYGWCESCGEAINPNRLSINPATPYCILCADKN